MSSASNLKADVPPAVILGGAAAGAPAPKVAGPRWPRANRAIDATIRALSLVGLGFLKPLVAIARGEDPRAHMRQLWLDLGAPVIAMVAFLLVWSQVSAGIQTSLGQIPGPAAVWE